MKIKFFKNNNDELLQHLMFEYKKAEETPAGGFGTAMLHEAYGYPDKVYWVDKVLTNYIVREKFIYLFDKKDRNETKTVTIDDMDLFQNITFFNDYKLTVIAHNIEGKNDYTGGYSVKDSVLEYNDGNIYFKPIIRIEIFSGSFGNFTETLGMAIGHEFTHAYNDYMLFKNTHGKVRLSNYYDKYHYINLGKSTISNSRKDIGMMLRHLIWFEQNAYVSQLKQELSRRAKKINSPDEANKAIKETEAFKVLRDIEETFAHYFCRTNLKEAEKKLALINVNELTGKDFKTFDDVKRYIAGKIERWKNKFYTNASKIACEIYINETCVEGI